MRSRSRAVLVLPLALAWIVAKWFALWWHVFAPDEYSDTYYYFLQCQRAASGGGLAAMVPEYPTPAAAVLMLPWWLGMHDPTSYRWGFLVLMVGVDAAFTAVLLARRQVVAAACWIVLVLISGRLGLLRFDVLPAVLAGAAVALLLAGRPARAGVAVALGTAAKVWPVILAPVLLLGDRRTLRRTAATFAASGLVLVAGSVLAAGVPRLLSPLSYQRDRGLQIEAVAATWPMLARLGDRRYGVGFSQWNAYEISGPGVAAALRIADVASVLAVLLVGVLLVAWWRSGRGAEAAAHLVLLEIALFTATSKALSPQYLLWLAAPAAVLLDHAVRSRSTTATTATMATPGALRRAGVTAGSLAVLMVLTSLVYPPMYDDLLRGDPQPTALLAVRNVGLLALCCWETACVVQLVATGRRHRRARD